jgi:hypothetical protein
MFSLTYWVHLHTALTHPGLLFQRRERQLVLLAGDHVWQDGQPVQRVQGWATDSATPGPAGPTALTAVTCTTATVSKPAAAAAAAIAAARAAAKPVTHR